VVAGLIFESVEDPDAAAVTLTWSDRSAENKLDGVGGEIAHATAVGEGGVSAIVFDSKERWDLRELAERPVSDHVVWCSHGTPAPSTYHVHPVALHEISHVLGFSNSSDPTRTGISKSKVRIETCASCDDSRAQKQPNEALRARQLNARRVPGTCVKCGWSAVGVECDVRATEFLSKKAHPRAPGHESTRSPMRLPEPENLAE